MLTETAPGSGLLSRLSTDRFPSYRRIAFQYCRRVAFQSVDGLLSRPLDGLLFKL
ncbi:MAG: hypothetical protein LBL33_09620 [Tannerella sp.]|nr:hypothetical protein [Tannerella sp.]